MNERNPHDSDDSVELADRLGRGLHHRADDMTAAPLTFHEVRGRAGTIRRHRRIAVTAGAAAAVAVLVPTAMLAGQGLQWSQDDVGPATSTPSAIESDGPNRIPGAETVLAVGELPRGAEPALPYLLAGVVRFPDGAKAAPETTYPSEGFVHLAGDDRYVVATRDDEGNSFVEVVDGAGTGHRTYPATDSLVANDEETMAAWVSPDGVTSVQQEGRAEPVRMAAVDGDGPRIAAIWGSDCTTDPETTEGGGCTALVNTWGDTGPDAGPRALLVSSHGFVDDVGGGVVSSTDVDDDRNLVGLVSLADDGSCSAVLSPERRRLWETCDFTLGEFSPDGTYVYGIDAYLDGLGQSTVAILDAATGDLVAHYTRANSDPLYVHSVTWEDDTHLLVNVNATGRGEPTDEWHAVRLDTSGAPEAALAPQRGPIGLPAR